MCVVCVVCVCWLEWVAIGGWEASRALGRQLSVVVGAMALNGPM